MSFNKNRKEVRRERQKDYSYSTEDEENPETKAEALAKENIRRLDHEKAAEHVKNVYLHMVMGIVEGRLPLDTRFEIGAEGNGIIVSDRTQSKGVKIENRRAVRRRTHERGTVQNGEVKWAEEPVFMDSISTGWHHHEHGKLVERDAP